MFADKGSAISTDDAKISRRGAVGILATLAAAGVFPGGAFAANGGRFGAPTPFSWDMLVSQARSLAAKPYVAPATATHAAADFDEAVRLTYGDLPAVAGNIRLFPAARINAPKPVRIAIVANGQAREIIDTSGLFAGHRAIDPVGFRVMDDTGRSDWLAFQGASYFRASGSRDQYGLSARGIAVDTGLSGGEEFPDFTRFWVEQTGPDTTRVHALLDGPSLCGAYAFECRNTKVAVIQDVTAALFLRKNVAQLGLAPVSSMFWYDQASPRARPDWRPEIHDSDGLAIWSGNGERVWRPLENPSSPRLHALRADSPRGFGLLQRDQAFDHYQDDGAFYDRRPSLWIEPKGNWGPGAVGLFEMPTTSETLDNVAIFWKADRPAKAGERHDIAYRLTWLSQDPTIDGTARCVNVYEGAGGIPGAPPVDGVRKFVFDFAGSSLTGLDRSSGVTPQTDLPAAAVAAASAYPIARGDGRWRAMIDVRMNAAKQPQFRLFLKRGNAALSETVIKAIET